MNSLKKNFQIVIFALGAELLIIFIILKILGYL